MRFCPKNFDYEEIRDLFERALLPLAESVTGPGKSASPLGGGILRGGAPAFTMSTAKRTARTQVYNEMHGLIVGVGKNYCKKSQARCDECPLQKFLPGSKYRLGAGS